MQARIFFYPTKTCCGHLIEHLACVTSWSLTTHPKFIQGAFGADMGQDKARQDRTGQNRLLCIVFGRPGKKLFTVLLYVRYG